MKKPLILVVLLTLISISVMGQKNYQKAFVVTLKEDTIHGFINYRDWGMNPRHIGFKRTLDGKKLIYKPLGIKSFFVHGETYQSALVNSKTSNSDFASTMSHSPKVKTRIDSAFLKVLVSGSKSLFYYKNPLNIENFYIMEDGKPVLLIYKKYIKQGTAKQIYSNSFLFENRKYIGQLLVYLKDCPKLESHINAANYSSKSLINIFQDYYKCKNGAPKSIQKSKKIEVKLGLFAGVTSITKLYAPGINLTLNSKMKFMQSPDICGGAVVDIIFPWNLQEWSLHNEIEYSSFSNTFAVNNSPKGGYYTDFNASFGYSSIAINDLVRFTYSFGTFSVFANAGVSNGFILNYTNHLETIHGGPGSSTPTIVESNFVKSSNLFKTDLAPMAGVGLSYKNLNMEIRLEKRVENSGDNRYNRYNERTSVLLGYIF